MRSYPKFNLIPRLLYANIFIDANKRRKLNEWTLDDHKMICSAIINLLEHESECRMLKKL